MQRCKRKFRRSIQCAIEEV